jgi:hypothetical protein
MTLALPGAAVLFFSFLGFWKPNALPFMLASGASLAVGFQWFDVYTTDFGLTVSLMFIAYSWVCVAYAFRCLFWRGGMSPEE